LFLTSAFDLSVSFESFFALANEMGRKVATLCVRNASAKKSRHHHSIRQTIIPNQLLSKQKGTKLQLKKLSYID
jgi:hypothetical protein